jgi:hypothetical protein
VPCSQRLPFDDPSFWQDREALCYVRTFDNLHIDVPHDVEQGCLELRALVAAIGVELQQEGIQAEQGGHHQHPAIAILQGGRMNDGVQDQTLRVYQEMALLAFDLLASVEAVGIDMGPPFSALLTLWLSMMAAVGEASLWASSRHLT